MYIWEPTTVTHNIDVVKNLVETVYPENTEWALASFDEIAVLSDIGWCLAGDSFCVMDRDEPEKWARIIHPDRQMPAPWDGPGD